MASPTILLRSSWQTVNIGDIAHTPGLLAVLAMMRPSAHVILWPRNISGGVREMLLHHFPKLEIAEGGLDEEGGPATAALAAAWARADLFLHGSGPAPLCAQDAGAWAARTGKPFGFFGITAERPGVEQAEILDRSNFVLTRETHSLAHLKEAGVSRPVMEFCPDATFACDLRDDAKAEAFLKETGLSGHAFLCVIPRLRYTPYYKILGREPDAEDLRREAVNRAYAESDHAKLRDAVIHAVRCLDLSVLVCPEMTYQLDILDELLVDPLPDDVRERVAVRRTYWLTDEAASVYRRARAVVSFECHSPILALRQGVPVLHLRQPTDTIKGQMWRDIGLADWILEIDEVTGADIASALDRLLLDPGATSLAVAEALDRICHHFHKGVSFLDSSLRTHPAAA